MRARSLLVTLIGVAVAGGSVSVARDFIKTQSASLQANADVSATLDVIVARADIPFGKTIEPHMLTTQTWPKEAVPMGAFIAFPDLLGEGNQEPRRAKRAISQGELLLNSKVSNFGEKVTIVQTLGENTRAVAIKVDAETAVGGFVTPGDTIDIVLTQGRNDSLRAVTILQNIRVIGVDQDSNENQDKAEIARTITVEVTPLQGQKLALAQKAGTLSLTLRTLDNVVDAPLDLITLSDLMREKSPVPEAATPRKPSIRVRRGNQVETVELN